MKILVAEKSSLMLENIGEMINSFSQIEVIDSIKKDTKKWEALRILKPDKTIVEIRIPGLSGAEVLNEIRKKEIAVNFFVLSFYASNHYPQCTIFDGAEYFFLKSYDDNKKS